MKNYHDGTEEMGLIIIALLAIITSVLLILKGQYENGVSIAGMTITGIFGYIRGKKNAGTEQELSPEEIEREHS